MTDLPAPPTPAECDLRDFAFIPLDVVRLRDSDLAGVGDPEAFRASVLSWCVAWHQVPAGSLPDDDATLCRILGYGRDLEGWKRVRAAGGLHGWIKCSDGRLYHPVVAEKVEEAWAQKQTYQVFSESQSKKGKAGAAKRWGLAHKNAANGRTSDSDSRGHSEQWPVPSAEIAAVNENYGLKETNLTVNKQEQEQQDPPSRRSGGDVVDNHDNSPSEVDPQPPPVRFAEEKPSQPSGTQPVPPGGDPPSLPEPPDAVLSAEDQLWAMAPQLERAGVARSQIGKLLRLTGEDFERCAEIAEAAAKARKPRSYIGGVVRNLERETGEAGPAPPRPGVNDTPEWVRREQADGGYVSVDRDVTARKGARMWRWNGELFDDEGNRHGW